MQFAAAKLIRAADAARSVRFYEETFGIQFEQNAPNVYMGRLADNMLLVITQHSDPSVTDSIAFQVENIDEAVNRILDSGGEMEKSVHYGPLGPTALLLDPDGLRIELVQIN
jgi:predicted enzyme related to lactoylglutathione lyase